MLNGESSRVARWIRTAASGATDESVRFWLLTLSGMIEGTLDGRPSESLAQTAPEACRLLACGLALGDWSMVSSGAMKVAGELDGDARSRLVKAARRIEQVAR